MAFKDITLPATMSFGGTGGPAFKTDVVVTNGGHESRNRSWAYELSRYVCSYDARLPVDWTVMYAFFRVVGGMADTFRARDPLDYSATTAEGRYVATAIATEWQMVKRSAVGAYAYDMPVTKPVSGSATPSAGTINFSTGIVTNATMPASWSGNFDKHVRFGTDEMQPRILDKTPGKLYIVGWEDIPIYEMRG